MTQLLEAQLMGNGHRLCWTSQMVESTDCDLCFLLMKTVNKLQIFLLRRISDQQKQQQQLILLLTHLLLPYLFGKIPMLWWQMQYQKTLRLMISSLLESNHQPMHDLQNLVKQPCHSWKHCQWARSMFSSIIMLHFPSWILMRKVVNKSC